MKEIVKIQSHLPPVCFEDTLESGKYWLACGGQWIEVDHLYSSEELALAWINERQPYKPVKKAKSEVKVYEVAGSGGKIYKVKNADSKWTCNCPSSTFHRWNECKHIQKVKSEL